MNELFVPAALRHTNTKNILEPKRPFAGGPRPDALILTCSESSLDEPLKGCFEADPVFLLRTFGTEVPEYLHAPGEFIEALEEAVCWWRVPRIVVCGHSGCQSLIEEYGSIKPGHTQSWGPIAKSPSLVERVAQANRILALAKSRTVEQSVSMRTYPFIENAIHEHGLRVSALFYLHDSGLFLRYDEEEDEYYPLM